MSFKFRKELIEEQQRLYTNYKVRMTANWLFLFVCKMPNQEKKEFIVTLGRVKTGDKLTVNRRYYRRSILCNVEGSETREKSEIMEQF